MKKTIIFLTAILAVIILSANSLSIPTLVVEETEKVKVDIDTFDPDGDVVSVIYSAPLDENGEWQTDYGDAGEYTTVVVANDGKSITEEEVLIIVKRKNKAPEIKVSSEIEAYEGDLIKLNQNIVDPNGDKISVDISEPFNKNGEWQTGYDDAGEYEVSISASDEEFEATKLIRVVVYESNRLPEIVSVSPDEEFVSMEENEEAYFSADVFDRDGDDLIYLWILDNEIVAWEDEFSYYADYNDAGSRALELVVSDGTDEISRIWNLEIENVNRAPVLPEFETIELKEGDLLELQLPSTDEDGDKLNYYFDDLIGENFTWQTGYEDAGEYEVEVSVSDGDLEDEGTLLIYVENVDRPPVFEEIGTAETSEGQEVVVNLEASDPDGDEIYYQAYDLPEGALLYGEEIVWEPDYDFVRKPDNVVVGVLERLRLDRFFWQKSSFSATVAACSETECVNQTFKILVNNVNREPVLYVAEEIEINETDKLRIKPRAEDPDGDRVRFYFSEPLDSNGRWETGYEAEGEYWVSVGATDGKQSVEKPVRIVVNNLNRQPEIAKISDREVNEGEDVWIRLDATDPDNDELDLWAEEAPEDSSFKDQLFHWVPSHDLVQKQGGWFNEWAANYKWLNRKLSQEKENFGVYFAVSDGDFTVSKLVNIAVRNWNRAPEIVNSTPDYVQAYVGEPVLFSADVVDLDGDELSYEWDFGFMKGGVENTNAIMRRFTSPGEKKIVLTVSDGRDSVEKEWTVMIGRQAVEPVEEPVEEVVEEVVEEEPEPVEPQQPQYVFNTYVV